MTIYDHLIEQLTLLPAHRESLKSNRGFSDTTIDRLRFRSCTPSNGQIIQDLSVSYPDEIKNSGLIIEDEANSKLLKDNVLIPYIDWKTNSVVQIRPHKDFLAGQALRPYLPAPIGAFIIFCESEFKAIACWQWGFPAVGAGGVGAFSGKNFNTLLKVLHAAGTSAMTIIFDNEVKNDPNYKNYKEDHWVRYDTQYHAILIARRLLQDGIEATITDLPDGWRVEGKCDLDGALAQGRTKLDIDTILRLRKGPEDYLKALPEEAKRVVAKKLVRKWVPVRRMHNKYWIEDDEGGLKPISNFTFDIVKTFVDMEGRHEREILLQNDSGTKKLAKLPLGGKELSNFHSFSEVCMTLGDFHFEGTQKEFQHIVTLETSRDMGKEVQQISCVGWIDRGKEPGFYLLDNCAITGNGTRLEADEDGIVWSGFQGYQPVSIMREPGEDANAILHAGIPAISKKELDPAWLIDEVEINFSGYPGVKLAVAWLYSTFFSHWAYSTFNRHCFPMLFVGGQKRSGKSTFCRWLVSMAGVKQLQGYGYWQATPAGIERVMAHFSSWPIWIDEFRNSNMDIARAKEGLFRSIYDRQSMLKAARIGKDYGIRGTQTRGCLILSGEDTPEDPALQTRFINIQLEKRFIKDRQNSKQFIELAKLIPHMSGIIPTLIKRFDQKKSQVSDAIEMLIDHFIEKDVDDRTAVTYAIPIGFYDALVRPNDTKFSDWCAKDAQTAYATKVSEEPHHKFLETLCDMKAEGQINSNHVRITEDDFPHVAINFRAAWKTWTLGESRIKRDTGFSQKSLLDRFMDEDYFVERDRQLRFNANAVACLILDSTKNEQVKSLYDLCVNN